MSKLNTAIRGAQIASALAGTGLEWTTDDILGLDLNELTEATVDVSTDSIAIVDANDSNASRKELIADLMTAVAGTGITATDGVLSADAITDNIIEADILFENESDNCNGSQVEFTLSETPLSNSVQVFLNGLIQEAGSGKDYTITGTTITFAVAPASGDILMIHYIRDNDES